MPPRSSYGTAFAIGQAMKMSPRKARLIVDVIRGKAVDDALAILRFLPSPSARDIAKVVKSAAANAENNFQMSPEDLVITEIQCDDGPTPQNRRRWRPVAHGRAHPIRHRTSNIRVVVEERIEE
jgi:large subunit ribosomal protein L22